MWRKKWFLEIKIHIYVVMIKKKKRFLMIEKSDLFLLLKKMKKIFLRKEFHSQYEFMQS